MPTSTDLVTDLPADFEVFGQAVATSMADLLGGTTGQVLSKASNTDMDFTWVTSDDANAIQNTIVDAKGDLIAATAADTPARLAVGTNGQVLTADSTAATGLAWATASAGSSNVAGKNAVLNSNMSVWQRGTSMAGSATAFAADRWQAYRSVAGSTYSRQATNDTTNLPFIQYATRVQRDSGNTATAGNYLLQNFESINSIPFAGKTVTFSFYARAGANFSAASSIMEYNLATGTGTDQNLLLGFTGRANPILGNATLTTTWQRFSFSATLATTATQVAVAFDTIAWVGTAGANDWFEVTGVQLEIAGSASAYSPNSATIQGELAACQRYYVRWSGGNSYSHFGTGVIQSATNAYFTVVQPVEMRVAPTALDYSTMGFFNYVPNVFALSNLALNSATTKVSQLYGTTSGATAQQFVTLCTNNSSAGFIGLSAEL